jgi:hypothetical protein
LKEFVAVIPQVLRFTLFFTFQVFLYLFSV